MDFLQYKNIDQAANKVGNRGCVALGQNNWKFLSCVWFYKNAYILFKMRIDERGCSELTKIASNKFDKLNLCSVGIKLDDNPIGKKWYRLSVAKGWKTVYCDDEFEAEEEM